MKLILLALACFFAGFAGARIHSREKWIAEAMRYMGIDRRGAEVYWRQSIATFVALACVFMVAYWGWD